MRKSAENSFTIQLQVQDYTSITAQHKNCPSSALDGRQGRDLFRVVKRSPISQMCALCLRRSCSNEKAGSNM